MDNIFLIGSRGTGKTTVARLLAAELAWPWCDADAVLEEHHGKTIKQIFAAEGEAGFREKETAVLAELCQRERQVIATGGGVILRAENRALLRASGTVVWLTAAPAVLWQRLQQDATTAERRPNLLSGGLAEIETLLRARQPFYAEVANGSIDTGTRSALEVAQAILRQFPTLRQTS